ncbi:molybdate ABC transporter substrate-binding protein [Nitratidesulfovibrio termitidis]|uniref:molybdate ABC transporter substrate-binding protein n=1 Tax=Nitratidesulfovibrio termitidis TaxID=42252 RepID=UPI00042279A5|nr:molybdate ABC transporter substrate-binding protein [Nitratidesulfovibrio termitidis]
MISGFRPFRTARRVLAALALAALVCAPLAAQAGEITVSAAASLTNAFTDLKGMYEKTHAGSKVQTNFAASGALLKQMQEGAPVDVFASADQVTMDKAVESKLIDVPTRVDFATNSLVLIVPSDSKLAIASVDDLKKANVTRVAVGNPDSVPVGRYTKAALTAAGSWDAISGKAVLAESVRQALDYVARGEVEAGFVYMTDAKIAGEKVKVVATVKGHAPITYPIAILSASKDKTAGAAFIKFVTGPEGSAVLAKYGFGKP